MIPVVRMTCACHAPFWSDARGKERTEGEGDGMESWGYVYM